jgi:hypothetical protein
VAVVHAGVQELLHIDESHETSFPATPFIARLEWDTRESSGNNGNAHDTISGAEDR